MTIKQLYKFDFDTAIKQLMATQDDITMIDSLKEYMREKLNEDYFNLVTHLAEALHNSASAFYYSYDYSRGTFATPYPLTDLTDLEQFCTDYKPILNYQKEILTMKTKTKDIILYDNYYSRERE